VRRAAFALAGVADAALFGDTGWARVQLPPSYRAALVAAEGLRPWAGLNCRDRNRVALEGELAGLAAVGAAVHCITGDHPGSGHRADAAPVFDLDSLQLAALARAAGVLVSVAENPVAPPVDLRPGRAAEKAKAGAHLCIVNHAGSAERVRWFVEATKAAGAVDLRFLACVPLVTSEPGLRLLRTFTGLVLPAGFIERIEQARDPFAAGVDEAIRFAVAVLDVPHVCGVDLGVVFPPGDEEAALAGALAASRALRGR
jgi:5,10-methylenetetrahydrofolate reductase